MIKLTQDHVGKFCMVQWDDVGKMEGLIVEVENRPAPVKNAKPYQNVKVFFPIDSTLDNVEGDQIVSVGKRIVIPA